jgi:O-antigen/teichoic acid export membrane protein
LTVAASAAPPAKLGIRERVLRGSMFEIGGYGAQQVLRLGSNLITTRLLFPAAFGLSSLVSVLTAGLVMFSDVALQPCVVQSKRGDDPAFLNSAFTIQAVRGFALAVLMVALAKPAAWFYREPQLENLVYLGSLQLALGGLHSTSIFTLRRRLHLGWVNGLELAQTAFTIPLTIGLAWMYPSAWALVISAVAGTLFFVVASHFLPVGYRNRPQWDWDAVREIRTFGRWVLGSSAATFIGAQADRILMGRFLGASWLGIYAIALTLSEAVSAVVGRLINGVMYPVLSEAARQNDGNISELYYRMRARFDLLSMGATGLLAGAGGWFVHVLWDPRYADAAWILNIACVKVAVTSLVSPSETCLFSLGHTRYGFQRSVVRLLAALAFIPAGWAMGGVRGLIWGTVAAEAFTALAIWPKCWSLGLLRIRREALSAAIFGAALGIGRLILPWLPQVHLR